VKQDSGQDGYVYSWLGTYLVNRQLVAKREAAKTSTAGRRPGVGGEGGLRPMQNGVILAFCPEVAIAHRRKSRKPAFFVVLLFGFLFLLPG
jgi:hypothetical protein